MFLTEKLRLGHHAWNVQLMAWLYLVTNILSVAKCTINVVSLLDRSSLRIKVAPFFVLLKKYNSLLWLAYFSFLFPVSKKWRASQRLTIRRRSLPWNSHPLMWQIVENPCSSLSVSMLRWLRRFPAQSSKAVKLPHYELRTTNSEALLKPEEKLPQLLKINWRQNLNMVNYFLINEMFNIRYSSTTPGAR